MMWNIPNTITVYTDLTNISNMIISDAIPIKYIIPALIPSTNKIANNIINILPIDLLFIHKASIPLINLSNMSCSTGSTTIHDINFSLFILGIVIYDTCDAIRSTAASPMTCMI